MAYTLISGLIPFLQTPGLMLEMEDERQKLLKFFIDTVPVIPDAELRAQEDHDVRTWLLDLNDIVYSVESIVDDFRYAKFQAEVEANRWQDRNFSRLRPTVRSCLFLFSYSKISRINEGTLSSGVLEGMENRIGIVMKKFDCLFERIKSFNIQPVQKRKLPAYAERLQQLIFSTPTSIGGRNKEKEDLVNALFKESRELFTIYILGGREGIGKTALARLVCQDARIKNEFECVVWVEIGSKFHIGKVSKTIIDQIIGNDCCISEDDIYLLQLRLHKELRTKKCIVVLDDVQDDVQPRYEQLLVKFISWLRESRLIVTTNSDQVVLRICKMGKVKHYVHTLQPLMADDAWNIFCKKAFPNYATKTYPENKEEMSRKIMVICGGSPLAVNMMGGLMRFKKGPEEWRRVINQLKIEVLNGGRDGVLTGETIIKVCYDNLSSRVKQCLAFCSYFPKGVCMEKEVLIKLWTANGLLLSGGQLSPEERGNNVFNELVWRHFFEDVKFEGYSSDHSRVTCNMVNLIRQQAEIAAREFALEIMQIPADTTIDIPGLLETNPTVRILLFPDDLNIRYVNCSAVPNKNFVRGLHLHSASFQRDLLELKYMRHLRYLDLSGSRIKALPEDTSLLYFLEYLNLSKCLLLYQLPENMKYMRSLRHLYIHKCPKLKKMPPHFRELNNLHTLTTYIVGDKNAGTGIDEIRNLRLSGLLELYSLHKVKTRTIAKEADLVSKTNLDRLTLCWGSEQLVMPKENNDFEVLEALQPHQQLKVLKVQQYGGRIFATWLANPVKMGLTNLVEVHLIGCSQCETLPAVWMLPSLRVLCLKHMPSLICISRTDEEDSSEPFFPSLKRLVLVGLKKLERWQEEEEELLYCVLEELEITSCPNLKTMPRAPQLKHITVSIENYRLLQSFTDIITQPNSLVEKANIAKASNDDNEPFPALGAEVEGRSNYNLRIMRIDSTDSFFMPTTIPYSPSGFWKPFKALRYLEILNCNTLVFWPLELSYLPKLTRLSIRMCPNLTGILPAHVEEDKFILPHVQNLEFYGCISLTHVLKCSGLRVLELEECPQLKSVSGIQNLNMLYLSCTSWTTLPSGLGTIEKLGTLWVSHCYSLASLPHELARDSKYLDTLVIHECPMVKELPGGHEWLNSLEKLQITHCPDLEKFCKQEPYSIIMSRIGTTTDS